MKRKIAITIDEDVLYKIIILANKEDRNTSNQINKILKEYLSNKEKE